MEKRSKPFTKWQWEQNVHVHVVILKLCFSVLCVRKRICNDIFLDCKILYLSAAVEIKPRHSHQHTSKQRRWHCMQWRTWCGRGHLESLLPVLSPLELSPGPQFLPDTWEDQLAVVHESGGREKSKVNIFPTILWLFCQLLMFFTKIVASVFMLQNIRSC